MSNKNFFSDNLDLQFHLHKNSLLEITSLRENNYQDSKCYPSAPKNFNEALKFYQQKLEETGSLCAEKIAERASLVDIEGCELRDGEVFLAPDTVKNLNDLREAGLMGVTLPREFGGLNMPITIYTMMTEMISRADASLQNLFGLQDIAETINSFADQDIKEKYLPDFAKGKLDGAMVLTEPGAGSDLQAVQTSASFDEESGKWLINGRKHFITNGCAQILLVLARSEPGSVDGRGLSLFLVEKGAGVTVQRIEDKLGLHGSPTCELLFNNAPAILIGRRRRGLTRYIMSLMNAARLAISAQATGISEAAFRTAMQYCSQREQFGKALKDFAQVKEMLSKMKIKLLASRVLLYETCKYVDLRNAYETLSQKDGSPAEYREKEKEISKIAAILTPMAKAFNTEASNEICYDAIQCMGGKGYMRGNDAERFYREARITNIYEGTTQMQVIAAIGGIMQRNLEPLLDELTAHIYTGNLEKYAKQIAELRKLGEETLNYVEKLADSDFFDLSARKIVESYTLIFIAALLLRDAKAKAERTALCEEFLKEYAEKIKLNFNTILLGDKGILSNSEAIFAL